MMFTGFGEICLFKYLISKKLEAFLELIPRPQPVNLFCYHFKDWCTARDKELNRTTAFNDHGDNSNGFA